MSAYSRTDIGAHASPGVNSHNHATLEDEGQGGGAVTRLHQLHHLALKGVHLPVNMSTNVNVDLSLGLSEIRTQVIGTEWANFYSRSRMG